MQKTNQLPEKDGADVILISGFLGSGKTTLLKRILAWDDDLSDTVVLVNEFGAVGIDGSLLKDSGSDVVELTSGCICCTLAADLRQSLHGILERFNPSRVLIEGSGVADPVSIRSTLLGKDFSEKLKLRQIITVLDADLWEGREIFGPLFYHQLDLADLILLNKVDLLPKQRIAACLNEIHEQFPATRAVPTLRCNIDPAALVLEPAVRATDLKPISFFKHYSPDPAIAKKNPGNQNTPAAEGSGENMKGVDASAFVTFSFQSAKPLDEDCFKAFIHGLPWELFRMKGPVRFPDRTAFVNFVGGKDGWSQWEGSSETRLAFVGWNIRTEEILQRLKACL
ncbi:MAG: GTP-binding protein [Deltaproteobacteria bacterium]|jgi:G3E family GTPase|nr:GTP-binding protein [Deltaproteobacteria bacterium]